MAVRSLAAWWKGGQGLGLLLPQGGSTLTQQLVRGYFLRDLTSRSDQDALFHVGPSARKTDLFRVITLSRSSLWSWPRRPASRGGLFARYLRIRMFPFGR